MLGLKQYHGIFLEVDALQKNNSPFPNDLLERTITWPQRSMLKASELVWNEPFRFSKVLITKQDSAHSLVTYHKYEAVRRDRIEFLLHKQTPHL